MTRQIRPSMLGCWCMLETVSPQRPSTLETAGIFKGDCSRASGQFHAQEASFRRQSTEMKSARLLAKYAIIHTFSTKAFYLPAVIPHDRPLKEVMVSRQYV